MELIDRERDRLLHRTARVHGLSFTAASLVCLSIGGAVGWEIYLAALPLYALLAYFQFRLGGGRSIVWAFVAVLVGLALIAIISRAGNTAPTTAGVTAASIIGVASLASCALVLTTRPVRRVMLAAVVIVVGAVSAELLSPFQPTARTLGLVLVVWGITTVTGWWITAAIPRASRRIASIGRAYRAERQASETEAQRRQGARLLHDTVLATLTLLAHSGVGVAPEALREQAADDARLLRQLRLGATPTPLSSGVYNLEGVHKTVLGTTLESVKQRFGRMGLDVAWHGTGELHLQAGIRDAFLLALAECLENVRRHSGVTEAHVTITEDEAMVRALVTDSGVGFVLDEVKPGRLGFTESVVARVAEVGGRARLFSSPGAGTTVVLEVPR